MLPFWVDKNVMCCSLLLTEGRFTPHLSGTDGALAMELPEYGVVAVRFLFLPKVNVNEKDATRVRARVYIRGERCT